MRGLTFTRYAYDNKQWELVFVCEECRRTQLTPGARVVIGEDFGSGIEDGGIRTGFVYDGTTFVRESD